MVEALGGFDPKATYDEASRDYEDASLDYWQYLSIRTVDRLGLQRGERVLDAPCGTGPSLVAAAQRVGPSGRVVGVDYAEQMVAIARRKVRQHRLENVEVNVGDMTAMPSPEEPYDVVVSVLGIFFAQDMPALVRSFHDLVRHGGRVAVTVFGEDHFEPLSSVFVGAVRELAPEVEVVQPWRRTASVDAVRRLFVEAGLTKVTIETDLDALPLASPEDWWRIVMGSGLRRTVASLGSGPAAEVRARCAAYIEREGVEHILSTSRYAIAVKD